MRKIKYILFFVGALTFLLCTSNRAFAIPKLQIWSPDSDVTYDMDTETWLIPKSSYELWIIGAKQEIHDVKIAFAVPEDQDGSIEIEWIGPDTADYGTGVINSVILKEISYNYLAYRNTYDGTSEHPTLMSMVLALGFRSRVMEARFRKGPFSLLISMNILSGISALITR